MAGDWIKMRNNLWDDPRVSRICDLTDEKEACVIGGLYWLWATADEHTEDGHMPGLTLNGIDRKTGLKGFAAALVQIGWLIDTPAGVTLQNFEDHNGVSAKRRCTDAQRKANGRNVSASEADIPQTEAGQKAPTLGAREEKRREEEDNTPPPSVVAPSPRATRKCPASFVVTPELEAWAIANFPAIDWRAETAAFRDHTYATARVDWDGAWRNWIRKSRPAIGNRGSPSGETAYQRSMREKVQQVAPAIAAQAPGSMSRPTFEVIDAEPSAATPLLG